MPRSEKSQRRLARLLLPGFPVSGNKRLVSKRATTQPSIPVSQAILEKQEDAPIFVTVGEVLDSILDAESAIKARKRRREK